MTCWSVAVLVFLGQTTTREPSELVSRLGATRYAERQAANSALERLGRPALFALRSAREAGDPEVRTRATALIDKIEGALLTQPTQIALRFEDVPLPEVVKAFSTQAGFKLALMPENAPQWSSRRVTLVEKEPLPFWKALDRLCDAGHLLYNPSGMGPSPNGREPVFPLFDGTLPASPTSDGGPFRVTLLALHYQRDVNWPLNPQPLGNGFTPARAAEARSRPRADGGHALANFTDQFYAQIQVAAEPRLTLAQGGAVTILEAVDDKGQALAVGGGRGLASQRNAGYFAMPSGSALHVQVVMTRPDQPGKTIRTLRGSLPVTLSTRKPDPLVVKLHGAEGRTFRNDDASLTVHSVRPGGDNRQATVEISLRPQADPARVPGNAPSSSAFFPPRPDLLQQQIELRDTQGRLLTWFQTNFDPESSRMTITVNPRVDDPNPAPAEIRYFATTCVATEVGFTFHDLPLP